MAQKRSKTGKKNASSKRVDAGTKITRIKASDKPHKLTSSEKAAKRINRELHKPANAPSEAEVIEQKIEKQRKSFKNPFASIWAYFRGAWYELRQVRWPDRNNTWKMTGALLAFCAFFIAIILLLDGIFKYLFELLIR